MSSSESEDIHPFPSRIGRKLGSVVDERPQWQSRRAGRKLSTLLKTDSHPNETRGVLNGLNSERNESLHQVKSFDDKMVADGLLLDYENPEWRNRKTCGTLANVLLNAENLQKGKRGLVSRRRKGGEGFPQRANEFFNQVKPFDKKMVRARVSFLDYENSQWQSRRTCSKLANGFLNAESLPKGKQKLLCRQRKWREEFSQQANGFFHQVKSFDEKVLDDEKLQWPSKPADSRLLLNARTHPNEKKELRNGCLNSGASTVQEARRLLWESDEGKDGFRLVKEAHGFLPHTKLFEEKKERVDRDDETSLWHSRGAHSKLSSALPKEENFGKEKWASLEELLISENLHIPARGPTKQKYSRNERKANRFLHGARSLKEEKEAKRLLKQANSLNEKANTYIEKEKNEVLGSWRVHSEWGIESSVVGSKNFQTEKNKAAGRLSKNQRLCTEPGKNGNGFSGHLDWQEQRTNSNGCFYDKMAKDMQANYGKSSSWSSHLQMIQKTCSNRSKASCMQLMRLGDQSVFEKREASEIIKCDYVPFMWESSPGKARISSELGRRGNSGRLLQLPPKLQASPLPGKSLQITSFKHQLWSPPQPKIHKLIKLLSNVICRTRMWGPMHILFRRISEQSCDKDNGELSKESPSQKNDVYDGSNNLFDGKAGKGLVIINGRAFFWPPSPSSSESDGEESIRVDSFKIISFRKGPEEHLKLELDILPHLIKDDEESIVSPPLPPIFDVPETFGVDDDVGVSQSTTAMGSSWYVDLGPEGDSAREVHGTKTISRALVKKTLTIKSIQSLVCKLKRQRQHAMQADMWSPTLATYLYDTKRKEEEKNQQMVMSQEENCGLDGKQLYCSSPLFSEGGWSLAHSKGSEQYSMSPVSSCSEYNHNTCGGYNSSHGSPWPFMSSPANRRKQLMPCKSFSKMARSFRGLVTSVKLILSKHGARATQGNSMLQPSEHKVQHIAHK